MQFDEEQLTEETIEYKTQQTLKILDRISTLYDIALKQAIKLAATPIEEAPLSPRSLRVITALPIS